MNAWSNEVIVKGHDQFNMKPDYMGLALTEWKRLNPLRRRESDLGEADRQWVIQRAKELERELPTGRCHQESTEGAFDTFARTGLLKI